MIKAKKFENVGIDIAVYFQAIAIHGRRFDEHVRSITFVLSVHFVAILSFYDCIKIKRQFL